MNLDKILGNFKKSNSLPSVFDNVKQMNEEEDYDEGSQTQEDEDMENRLQSLKEVFTLLKKGGLLTPETFDKKVKDLIATYLDSANRDKENVCELRDGATAPTNFNTMDIKPSLDRVSKIARLFSHVPDYKGESSDCIRDFLNNLTRVQQEVAGAITEREFCHILISKLNAKLRHCVESQCKDKTAKSLYNFLSLLLDRSENRRQALTNLIKPKRKYSSLTDFLQESLRLLALTKVDEATKASHLLHALQEIVPPSIYENLLEYVENKEAKNQEFSVLDLIKLLRKNQETIDNLLSSRTRGRVNLVNKEENKKEDEDCWKCNQRGHSANNCKKDVQCGYCNMKNHREDQCFKKRGDRGFPKRNNVCERCRRPGHIAAACRSNIQTRCRLCNSPAHASVNCTVYGGQEPVSQPCKKCETKYFIRLFHNESVCRYNIARSIGAGSKN